jgi:cobalt-zinc-cadmium efflux system protein
MKQLSLSRLHCEECSQGLIAQLERTTGHTGFAYDEEEQVLSIPQDADIDLVYDILAADKIAIRHNDEVACDCVDCRFPLPGAHAHDAHHDHETHDDHAHSHGHHHAHSHSHSHTHGNSVTNIAIVFAMNLIFSISEFIFGAILNSTAIFADAVHDLGDAISVGLALVLEKRSKRHADGTYSFGHRRFSLLGALITGLVLLLGSVFALARAVPRLLAPDKVNYDGMLVMALVAIALNAVSAWALSRGSSRNESMLNLHMLEDMLGWIGILIMSIVMRYTNWYILDPLFSIALSCFIIYKAAPSMWSTLKILMESVPENVPMEDIEQQLLKLPHVHGFTHLHLWSMDGQSNNFAVSLFTDLANAQDHKLLRERIRALLMPYNVECSTVEIDYDPEKRFVGKVR